MSLSERSLANLQGVHTDLVRVVARASQIIEEIEPSCGFVVTEGLRSLLRAGTSGVTGESVGARR